MKVSLAHGDTQKHGIRDHPGKCVHTFTFTQILPPAYPRGTVSGDVCRHRTEDTGGHRSRSIKGSAV